MSPIMPRETERAVAYPGNRDIARLQRLPTRRASWVHRSVTHPHDLAPFRQCFHTSSLARAWAVPPLAADKSKYPQGKMS
jgi:hypothetical protein